MTDLLAPEWVEALRLENEQRIYGKRGDGHAHYRCPTRRTSALCLLIRNGRLTFPCPFGCRKLLTWACMPPEQMGEGWISFHVDIRNRGARRAPFTTNGIGDITINSLLAE